MGDSDMDPKAQFDSIRQVSPYGAEYWSARELYPILGYDTWRRFESAVERAKIACGNMGEDVSDHFASAGKMANIGAGHQRELDDYSLSRFGCYLVAMNGDPRKPEIAAAQGYFAVQTRRMEKWDELREQVEERIDLRLRLADRNKQLNALAQERGVNSRSFGRLHNAGTRGLYGGMSVAEVKAYKGIAPAEDLADRMGPAELSANDFVRTQTIEKIRAEGIRGQERVIATHHEVGDKTRALIGELGSPYPENLPPEPSLRPLLDQRERQRKHRSSLAPAGTPGLFDALPDPDPGQKR